MKHYYYRFFALLLCSYMVNVCKQPKIVGLVAARNEEAIIQQSIHALSLYTDAIIFLDDASTDNTVSMVESIAKDCHVEKIIRNTQWFRDEPGDRNRLLKAGREIGGTHFIVIDADELLTANWLEDNKLKNLILSLKKGDKLILAWIQLWRSHLKYRNDNSIWATSEKVVAFADDTTCFYQSEFIHTAPAPYNLSGNTIIFSDRSYGLLHFQFVNWENLLIKQAWYACLERIRWPEKKAADINNRYAPAKDETNCKLAPSLASWFNEYSFFDESVYQKPVYWRKNQVLDWFLQYGKEYFSELTIWDINW